jgi:hypothetical protein
VTYGAVTGSNLAVTYSCEYCGEVGETTSISLVNKCYIEGYDIFDATLKYVSVSADGVLTPSSASFDRAVIYFPSFVMVDGNIVEVKTISGFKAYSIQKIYIPDTVTRIAGGDGKGCFGDCYDLKNIVVGKGVTKIEKETFCMGRAITVDEFIFKGTITEIHFKGLNAIRQASTSIPYEFKTYLSYVGAYANLDGSIIREAHIAKGCNLSEKFAFNDSNALLSVYIEGGDTPETALDLGREFTSNTATKYYYIKGYVTVSGQAVIAGQRDTRIFMESVDAIDVFASAIIAQGHNYRISNATFLSCDKKKAWYYTSDTDASTRAEHPSVTFFHGGVFTETAPSCTQAGSKTESCFVCGEVVSTTALDTLEHKVDGGVITVMPNCKDLGVIVYKCTNSGCKESKTISIFRDYSSHEYSYFIAYVNGFDKAGAEGERCAICKDTRNDVVLGAIITPIGYSVRNNRTGIDGGYQIDKALLEKYETQNGKIRLGIIITNATLASKLGLVDEDFELISDKGLQVEFVQRDYTTFSLYITGFNTDTLRALDLLITSYVVADLDGDGKAEISYCQYEMSGKDNELTSFDGKLLNTVSIDRADPVAVVPASYKPEEQN